MLPAALSWWLAAYADHYRLAAWINTSSALLIMTVMYWQSPFFGLYFLLLLQLVIARITLGRRETMVVFLFFLAITLLYSVLNDNNFYAPDGQLVKVSYGTFGLWWILIGGITWLISYLYDTVQHDNLILNQQATSLRQTLEELRYKQASSEVESRRVLALGGELSLISKQQQVGSQQQVSSLTQVAGFMEEMNQAARNIKDQTYQVRENANEIEQLALEIQTTFGEVLEAGNAGEEATRRTVEANQQVGEQYSLLREYLAELEQFQGQIRIIIETINSVSQETHLLSLNAAIEAAGAGVYGVVTRNLQTFGKPCFVDFTVPEEPLYSFQPPASFEKVFNAEQRLGVGSSKRPLPVQAGTLRLGTDRAGSSSAFLDLSEERFADKESFIKALSQQPVIQARFAQYLMQEPAMRKLKGVTIFDLFDLLELQFYYREFMNLA